MVRSIHLSLLGIPMMPTACGHDYIQVRKGEHAFGYHDDIRIDWQLCNDTERPDGQFKPGTMGSVRVWATATGTFDHIHVRGNLSFLSDRLLPTAGAETVVEAVHAYEPCSGPGEFSFPVSVSDDPISDSGELVQGTLQLEAYLPDRKVFQCEDCASWQLIADEPIQVLVSPTDGDKELWLGVDIIDDTSADGMLAPGETGTLSFSVAASALAPGFTGEIWMDDPYVSLDLPTDGARLEIPTSDLDPRYTGTLTAPVVIAEDAPPGHGFAIYGAGTDEVGHDYSGSTNLGVSESEPSLLVTGVLRDGADTFGSDTNDISFIVTNTVGASSVDPVVEVMSDDVPVPFDSYFHTGIVAAGESFEATDLTVELDMVPAIEVLEVTLSDDLFPSTTQVVPVRAGLGVLPVFAETIEFEEISGDGDDRPDPGEQLRVTVRLQSPSPDVGGEYEATVVSRDSSLQIVSGTTSVVRAGSGEVKFDLFVLGSFPSGDAELFIELEGRGSGIVYVPFVVD